LYKKDTIMVKTVYHNDRTVKQAKAVVDYLINHGIDGQRLSVFVNAIPVAAPENQKLTVKARAK
jgi:hypothetical protein